MYRILLADDEGIVLESMKLIINNYFKDKFEIATAKTGRAVIEMAENFHPDVAFMDIQMPGINGIDAIREIKKTNNHTIFIVLSAYDRFDYARESVNMGVFEYMNKPFKKEDIVEVLNRVIKVIDAGRKRRSDDLKIREKMETVTPIIENGFVFAMMFQDFSDEDVENYKQLLELDCDYGCMLVLSVGDEQKERKMTNAVGASVKIQSSYLKLRQMVKDTFPEVVVGSIISNKIPVFLPRPMGKMEYEERIAVIDSCRELARELRKCTDCKFRIGIGSVQALNKSLISYEEAMRALGNSNGSVAHVDDLPLQCVYDQEYPVELEKKLFESLESGKQEECGAYAGEYFDWMLQNYDEKNQSVRLKALEFVLFAEQAAYKEGGMVYHFSDRANYLETVFQAENNSDIKGWFVAHFQEACKNIATKKEKHENNVINQAKQYMNGNYSRELSLDEMSRRLDLSPYYFSKLFKEEVGVTFMDYLTKLRIEKAKDLLLHSNKTMKEICSEVGYADPNYFSRIFKKNTDLTPTEYREGEQ